MERTGESEDLVDTECDGNERLYTYNCNDNLCRLLILLGYSALYVRRRSFLADSFSSFDWKQM